MLHYPYRTAIAAALRLRAAASLPLLPRLLLLCCRQHSILIYLSMLCRPLIDRPLRLPTSQQRQHLALSHSFPLSSPEDLSIAYLFFCAGCDCRRASSFSVGSRVFRKKRLLTGTLLRDACDLAVLLSLLLGRLVRALGWFHWWLVVPSLSASRSGVGFMLRSVLLLVLGGGGAAAAVV